MISIPGSLFFVMSSAPAKHYGGDARCASEDPSIQRCPIKSRLESALGVRSSYVERNYAFPYIRLQQLGLSTRESRVGLSSIISCVQFSSHLVN